MRRQHQIQISMDGRGRWLENVFIEGLWRSAKDGLIDPGDFADGRQLGLALDGCFRFYNHSRPHQAPGLSHASRSVRLAGGARREGLRSRFRLKPGGSPLSAGLAARMFEKQPGCRTLEEPRWETGPRRDATRASREARTDRAAAMPPSEPAATHFRIGQTASKLRGPPQESKLHEESQSGLQQSHEAEASDAEKNMD